MGRRMYLFRCAEPDLARTFASLPRDRDEREFSGHAQAWLASRSSLISRLLKRKSFSSRRIGRFCRKVRGPRKAFASQSASECVI